MPYTLSYYLLIILILFIYWYKLDLVYITESFNESFRRKIYDFIMFFADEKTEDPTPKKLKDAKKKGQTAKSPEISSVVGLAISVVILLFFGNYIAAIFKETIYFIYGNISIVQMTEGNATKIFQYVMMQILKIMALILIPLVIGSIASNVAQVGFIFTSHPIKPDMKRINPIEGFKKIFSKRLFFDLLKNLSKLILILVIVLLYYRSRLNEFYILSSLELNQLILFVKDVFQNLTFRIIFVLTILSIADLYFKRYMFKKELRMTKHEIKEEYKESEGDPLFKSLRRQKQRQLAFNRMINEIPDATVVITNPTHFAIALRYEDGKDDVPVVVAKGMNYIAQKIKGIAKDNDVPIIENKPLARTLYKKVEINQRIPIELYQSVAEILAMIYSLEDKK